MEECGTVSLNRRGTRSSREVADSLVCRKDECGEVAEEEEVVEEVSAKEGNVFGGIGAICGDASVSLLESRLTRFGFSVCCLLALREEEEVGAGAGPCRKGKGSVGFSEVGGATVERGSLARSMMATGMCVCGDLHEKKMRERERDEQTTQTSRPQVLMTQYRGA